MRTSLFSDRPKSTPVHLRQMARTGRWQARCPECRAVLNRGTECGLLAALSEHLNTVHFVPRVGNA